MGFNKDVIRRRRDELAALGVRIRWAGRRPRLWRSVIGQLEDAEQYTRDNDRLTLQFCVNYGGRAELVDAVRAIAREVAAGRINPAKIDERTIAAHLDEPGLPDVDLFIRTSGEQRTSNFLLWQSAYAELMFVDTPWPDFDRRHLWAACVAYARRNRRFGARRARSRRPADDLGHPLPRPPTPTSPSGRGTPWPRSPRVPATCAAPRPQHRRHGDWLLLTEWENVGSYRRALGNYEVKLQATPLLGEAIDLPSAFESLLDIGPAATASHTTSDRDRMTALRRSPTGRSAARRAGSPRDAVRWQRRRGGPR